MGKFKEFLAEFDDEKATDNKKPEDAEHIEKDAKVNEAKSDLDVIEDKFKKEKIKYKKVGNTLEVGDEYVELTNDGGYWIKSKRHKGGILEYNPDDVVTFIKMKL